MQILCWQLLEIKLSCRKFKTALLYKVGTEAGIDDGNNKCGEIMRKLKLQKYKLNTRVLHMMVTTNMENESYNTTFKPKARMDVALQSWKWY